jgi:hypothetical protein
MPKEIRVSMPSRGLFEGSLEAASFREMKIKEEKQLFTSRQPHAKMESLIKGTMTEARTADGSDVDPEKVDLKAWPVADMTRALFAIRSVSIDRVYEVQIQCSTCRSAVPFAVDLEEGLETTFAPDDVQPEFDLDLSFAKVRAKHLLVGDQRMVNRAIRRRKAQRGINDDGGWVTRLAAQLVSIDGDPVPAPGKAEIWLDELTRREREELAEGLNAHAFGDDLDIIVDCPQCGAIVESTLPITRDFLFRRRKS